MAKAGQLAGLAALGALAYMNRDKLGMGDKVDLTQPSGDSNPTRGAGYQSTETREEPRRQITDYIKTAPTEPREAASEVPSASSDVLAAPIKPRNVVTNSTLPARPALKSADNTTAIAYPRMPGSFEGQNLPAKTVEEAEKNEADARKVAKAAQADANKSANNPLNLVGDELSRSPAEVKYSKATDQYKNLSRSIAVTEARKRAAAANTLKRQTQLSPFKKGGSVSSASKRADGIATKGKTRGKMY